jgi:hypothetical protein
VTILNESVLTSELIERTVDPVAYRLPMKLIDFLTFAVLSWALLVISPSANAFNVDVRKSLWGAGSPAWFWGLLIVYWLLTLGWNHVAGQRDSAKWQPWFYIWMHLTWAPPLIGLVAAQTAKDLSSFPVSASILNLVGVSGYLVGKLRAAA